MIYLLETVPAPGFAERLSKAIEESGLTNEKIGEHFDVSGQAVSQWRNDANGLRPERWAKLAKLLDVNMFWLFFGCGEKAGTTLDTEELEIFLKIRRLKPEYRTLLNRTVDSWLDDRAVPDPTRRAAG